MRFSKYPLPVIYAVKPSSVVSRLISAVLVCALLVASPITILPADRASASDFSQCSDFDDYDDWGVRSSYNISYLCVVLLSSQPDDIFFFINMTQSTRSTMFNDGLGSWAGVLIDTNADDQWDIELQTDDYTYPFGTSYVPASAFVNDRLSSCRVDSYMNVPGGGRYVAFRVSWRCLNLNPSNWKWKGYVDYIAADGTGFDYSSGSTRSDGGWWIDFNSFVVATATTTPTTTTTIAPTTTTTTTTIPIPNAPSSVVVSALNSDSVKVAWLDNSAGEEGFLIQRNDLPVPAGTTVAAWPYTVSANVTEWQVGGLSPGSQVCFAVAAFNVSGASRFTDFACVNLAAATTTTSVAASLSCDARWRKRSKVSVRLTISAGVSNAGKRLLIEAFGGGKWVRLGMTRVRANGAAALIAKGAAAKLKGQMPIRATQGSRFICEGTVR